jgi:hypothetical protein
VRGEFFGYKKRRTHTHTGHTAHTAHTAHTVGGVGACVFPTVAGNNGSVTIGNESSDELGRGGVERVARGCTRWEEVWSEEGWGDSGKGETRRAIILGVSHTRGGTIIHVGAWRSM